MIVGNNKDAYNVSLETLNILGFECYRNIYSDSGIRAFSETALLDANSRIGELSLKWNDLEHLVSRCFLGILGERRKSEIEKLSYENKEGEELLSIAKQVAKVVESPFPGESEYGKNYWKSPLYKKQWESLRENWDGKNQRVKDMGLYLINEFMARQVKGYEKGKKRVRDVLDDI
jgi:hypothetical protein